MTLRVRRQVQGGVETVSWALVSFAEPKEAQAAVAGYKILEARWVLRLGKLSLLPHR